jgi:DNA-directed RNA polymerase sigma subunit (sigma70/sigma32)
LSPKQPKTQSKKETRDPAPKAGKVARSSKARTKAASKQSGPVAADVVGLESAAEALKEKPLTREEKKAQRQKIAEGLWAVYREDRSDEHRNSLVEHYQPLIKEIARRFAARLPRSVDRGDLATASSFGLMSAIGGFDPERGVRFESYCELRVKGALLDELRTQDWLPRSSCRSGPSSGCAAS